MNQLINTIKRNGKIAVNARDLYRFVEVKTPFRKWFPRMIKTYGFVYGIDFQEVKNVRLDKHHRGSSLKDYVLTLDTAKEMAMVQRNAKGREARRYFIRVQKQYQSQLLNVQKNPAFKRVSERVNGLTNGFIKLTKAHNILADKYTSLKKRKLTAPQSSGFIPNVITITGIGRDFDKGPREMNQLLHNFGVIHKQGSTWYLYPEFKHRDLVRYRTFVYDGEIKKAIYWTKSKGKQFIHNIFASYGILPTE